MDLVDWDKWFFDLEKAKDEAKLAHKPIMIQFHRTSCSGCKRLYSLTYPNEDVSRELYDWFIPVRLDILKEHRIRSNYSAVWTPSFYWIDYKGKLYFFFPGYLNPEDFRIMMRLGLASWLIPHGKYNEAIDILNNGLKLFPNNVIASKLMFYRSMAKYLKTWDNKLFKDEISKIRENYPDSLEARMWPWED